MPDTASVILLGIQSAIKLGQQARQAYVDSTRNRALVLPLPNFNPEPNAGSALNYYAEMPEEEVPLSIRGAVAKFNANPGSPGLTTEERRMVLDYYNEYLLLLPKTWESISASPEGGYLTRDAVSVAVQIRRWEREAAAIEEIGQWGPEGAPGPSPLQRVAGTLVEIGIDYFEQVPGAFNDQTPVGKASRALLTSLDAVSFAEEPLGDLPVRLFVATLEGFGQNTNLLTSTEETKKLLSITATTLAKDVAQRIKKQREAAGGVSDADKEGGIVLWAELVFRSMLSSGGRLIANDPKNYLGIDQTGDAALVTKVGESVIDFVLRLPEGELHRTFGKEGLNVVVAAVLRVVGEHPEIIIRSDENGEIIGASANGLKKLLSDVATDLGIMPHLIYRPDLIPEIVRLILEKTSMNLPVLWPDYAVDPQKNLLVVAAQKTLEILTEKPAEGVNWNLQFDDHDLVQVVETVLDAFVENPGWLLDKAGDANEVYRVTLEAALAILRKRGDGRLSSETAVEILGAALRAATLRQEFLADLSEGEPLVGAAVDVILRTLFPEEAALAPRAAVVLLRQKVVATLVDESLQALGRADLSSTAVQQQHLEKLRKLLNSHITQILNGKGWNLDIYLQGLEKAIPKHLVTNN